MKAFWAVPSAGLLLALAACAPEFPSAEPGPSESSSSSAPTEPSPDPTRPSADELALAPGSLNLLVIGQPAPAPDDPTAMIVFDPEACVDPDFGIAPGDPGAGLWRAVPDYAGSDGAGLFGVAVGESGEVGAIQVIGPSTVPTTEGIVIGSTVTELLAAYPTITGPIDAVVSRLYVVDEGAGRLVFEVSWNDSAFEPYWLPDELDRVVVMTTHPTSVAPFAVWATDGGVGYCSV
jgi:hypothetical protein